KPYIRAGNSYPSGRRAPARPLQRASISRPGAPRIGTRDAFVSEERCLASEGFRRVDRRTYTMRRLLHPQDQGGSTMLRKIIVGGLMVVAFAGVPGSGEAGVNVNINLTAPPAFQVVPGTPVQYAPAVPTNYFLYGGRYYVFTDGSWFVA